MDVKRLGAAVRERRLALDMSQQDLGRRAEVDSSYISKIERGRNHRPGAAILERIAQALQFESAQQMIAGAGAGTGPILPRPDNLPDTAGLSVHGGPGQLSQESLEAMRRIMREEIDAAFRARGMVPPDVE